MWTDRVRGVAYQHNPALVPTRELRHVVDRIAALDPVDVFEDLVVGARVLQMQRSDLLCIAGGIGDFSVFAGPRGIGVEPIDGPPFGLEIAEKGIAAEGHPHDAAGIGNRRVSDAASADQPGEVRLRVSREHHVAHGGAQPVRRDEDTEIMPGAIFQLHPDAFRRGGHIAHLRIEPYIDAGCAGFGEQDFSEPPPANGDARRPERGLVVRLRGEGERFAFGIPDFDAGGGNAARPDLCVTADGPQPVHAVGRQGQEHALARRSCFASLLEQDRPAADLREARGECQPARSGPADGDFESASAIAKETALTPAAVTALIDRLEARGLVLRRPDASDRRKVLVEATDKTRELILETYAPTARAGEALLEGYSLEELATIRRFLEEALTLQQRMTQGALGALERDPVRLKHIRH
jgi:DNA-binding MarR family transcriptional regulator